MKKTIATLTIALTASLGLAACSAGQGAEQTPATETAETTVSRWTHLGPDEYEAKATADPQPEGVAEPVAEPVDPSPESVAADPTTVQAVPEDIWSEVGVGYNCAATDAWVYDSSNCIAANLGSDPSYDQLWGPSAAISAEEFYSSLNNPELAEQERLANIPMADGGTCPAAICGYGHDENGNRNPSSGELQMKALCESGSEYVTAEQCEAVSWVEHPNY